MVLFFDLNIYMLVSHTKKFIYTKTMKTAGTSTECWLERYCLPPDTEDVGAHSRAMTVTEHGIVGGRYKKVSAGDRFYNHMPCYEIADQLPGEWREYYKFTNTRNPWDRMVSMWWNEVMNYPPEFFERPFGFLQKRFSQWAKSDAAMTMMLAERPKYCVGDQYVLDGVIRYEHLEEDLRELSRKLDLDYDPSDFPTYKSDWRKRSESYRDYYIDQDTIDIVALGSSFEVNQFGYTF